VILKDLCPGTDVDQLRAARWDNCGITVIDLGWRDGRPVGELIVYSANDHLHGPASDFVHGIPEETL
jgi:hypothetical protein